jgi:hypothetical protein
MIGELVVRFFVGGALVSAFALLGDLFKPKSFGGLFGAAPSVALATLALTLHAHGTAYAAIEARSMVVGAIALLAYASAISLSLHRTNARVIVVVLAALLIWFGTVGVGAALPRCCR